MGKRTVQLNYSSWLVRKVLRSPTKLQDMKVVT